MSLSGPTLYEFAGGDDAFGRLAEAQYRRCLRDPVLQTVFGTEANPDHVPRLATWLAEVFGGPPSYSDHYGGHLGMIRYHVGLSITEEQRVRFIELMEQAADEAGFPTDPRFRERFHAYLEWGAGMAVHYSRPGASLPPSLPMPTWDWGPEGPPG